MINKFTKIEWFHSTKLTSITDYINVEDDENPCIISKSLNKDSDDTEKFQFLVSRRMAEDIHIFLEETINSFRRQENRGLPDIKIINLGFNCDAGFVRGSFEIKLKNELE